ncbi:MAG: AAA family ATPase, partial [Mariprofundales bacterium]|nr:AAA family ATPase [Mariprofundales bacterium]
MMQSPLGRQFARFIAEEEGVAIDSLLARSAAWLVDAHNRGDTCLNLGALAEQPWPDQPGTDKEESNGVEYTPPLATWRAQLLATAAVGTPDRDAPMVIDNEYLYLSRLWHDERSVADQIISRINQPPPVDDSRLQQGLHRLFPPQQGSTTDWQKVAAAVAICNRFAVIVGGPGTGKTRSLISVLALLLEQEPQMRIRLAAPTGKAAARMMEAIITAKTGLATDDATRKLIPEQASTLHRLLGYSPRGWRYGDDNHLPLDTLVIDEASMIDLSMMARLLQALPPTARLILLGDCDQLASVEAGRVLGDITGHGYRTGYDQRTLQRLSTLTDTTLTDSHQPSPPIANTVATLKKSYRFQADSSIGTLAHHVNCGAVADSMQLLANCNTEGSDITWWSSPSYQSIIDHAVA